MSVVPALYGYWRSSASWRVRLALNLKGIPYQYEAVHLVDGGGQQWTESYRSLNPMAEIPTLHIDGAYLSQSLPIIEYLEETRPTPALLPGASLARARCRQLAEIVNASIQPLQNLRVLKHLGREFGAGEEQKNAWAAHYIEFGLRAIEDLLPRTAGYYCVGDEITLADICVIPQIYNAHRFGVDMSTMPRLAEIHARLYTHPAVQSAHAERQPDAPQT
jgi:maleylpyruvate isomerase